VDESPVPTFVRQQPYQQQYKPLFLSSQLIAQQQKIDEDSDATVRITDYLTLKPLPPSQETKVKKMVLDGGGKWIKGSVQDTIFCSIDFDALIDKVGSDIMAAVGNWQSNLGWLWLLHMW
jgi:repressor of nif and glnA expression